MTIVKAKHLPYTNGHLGKVIEDMKVAGSPTIRAVMFQGELHALEGSHRLSAAHYIGLIPKIVIEETIIDSLPNNHWRRVSETLPKYEFDFVLKLDLSLFK